MVRKSGLAGWMTKSVQKDPRHGIRHDLPEQMQPDSAGSRDIAVTRLAQQVTQIHWQQTGQAAKASHVLRLQPA